MPASTLRELRSSHFPHRCPVILRDLQFSRPSEEGDLSGAARVCCRQAIKNPQVWNSSVRLPLSSRGKDVQLSPLLHRHCCVPRTIDFAVQEENESTYLLKLVCSPTTSRLLDHPKCCSSPKSCIQAESLALVLASTFLQSTPQPNLLASLSPRLCLFHLFPPDSSSSSANCNLCVRVQTHIARVVQCSPSTIGPSREASDAANAPF